MREKFGHSKVCCTFSKVLQRKRREKSFIIHLVIAARGVTFCVGIVGKNGFPYIFLNSPFHAHFVGENSNRSLGIHNKKTESGEGENHSEQRFKKRRKGVRETLAIFVLKLTRDRLISTIFKVPMEK